jgi:hypothetical protein
MPNIYISHGYADRNEYLKILAEEYDVDMQIVSAAADALGPNEDFDGLLTTLEDYAR